MKPVYITHTTAIAPQQTELPHLLQPLVKPRANRFSCVEPDYSSILPPMQLRRMSRLLKMSIYAAMKCLKQAGVQMPDGIITGTGKGSMLDTEKFVKDMKQFNEEMLNPTPFILSTYNAINGVVALQTKATGYNQTFVHRGSSFEISLYDACLKMNESNAPQQFLVGSFDEITAEYLLIKEKTGQWKTVVDTDLSLWQQSETPGVMAGEGVAFFMLQNQPMENAVELLQVKSLTATATFDLTGEMHALLQKQGWKYEDVDLVLLGWSGDVRDNIYYEKAVELFPCDMPVIAFKHLCGEYETAGSFALWLLFQYLQGEKLPDKIWYRNPPPDILPQKILYYNHFQRQQHNMILLERH